MKSSTTKGYIKTMNAAPFAILFGLAFIATWAYAWWPSSH